MGAGITEVTIKKGIDVVLKDAVREGLARGENQIDKNFAQREKKRQMTSYE